MGGTFCVIFFILKLSLANHEIDRQGYLSQYQPQLEPEPDPQLQNPKVTPNEIQNVTPHKIQIMTLDPNQVQIVTLVPSGQFQPVTPDPIQPVTPDQVQPVTPDPIQPIIPDSIQPMIPVQVQPVTPNQTQPVTQDQFQPVTPVQFQPVTPNQTQPEIQDQFQPMTPATPVTPATTVTPMTPVTPVTPIQPVTFRCDQTISYRDLDYLTAVDVMENENYLEETFDIDEIRFFRRHGFQTTSIANSKHLSRNKRHTTCEQDPPTYIFPTNVDLTCFCSHPRRPPIVLPSSFSSETSRDHCFHFETGDPIHEHCCPTYINFQLCDTHTNTGLIPVGFCRQFFACDNNPCANGGECSVELNNGEVRVNCECVAGFSGDNCDEVEEEEDSPLEEFLEDLMEILDPNGPIATPVATIGVLGLMMTAFSTPGSVPAGAPAAGSPGGGGSPTAPSPTLAASLALLPAGLTPISVFPPFLNPRTVPAVGVIFREPPVLLRKKRGSTLNNVVHEVKKMWAKFQKRLQCVGPTLTRKFSRNSRRVFSRRRRIPFQYYNRRHKRDLDTVAHFVRFMNLLVVSRITDNLNPTDPIASRITNNQNPTDSISRISYNQNPNSYDYSEEEEDFTLETVEDCFDDVPKPRFGLVVKITKDVTCESEINCPVPVSPENYYFQSRQTGEGFRSSAPPDCRVIVN